MTVTASTALDPIWALGLNVLNGVLDMASWASTNTDTIVSAIITIVTIIVVAKFGRTIAKFLGDLFGSIGNMIKL